MRKFVLACVLSSIAFAGCAVVNVYVTFPEEKIKEAAEDLLAPPPRENPLSRILQMYGTQHAYAQDRMEVRRDIQTDSPVIRNAKSRMDSWRNALDDLKKQGVIGETNSFEVVIRQIPSDPEEARQARKIVADENKERRTMMRELIRINNVPSDQQDTFMRIFTDVMHRYSPSGTWIQSQAGDWTRK